MSSAPNNLGSLSAPIVCTHWAALTSGVANMVQKNDSVLVRDFILVPHARWGSRIMDEGSAIHGVLAGVQIRYPAEFFWWLTCALFPDTSKRSPLEGLLWALWRIFEKRSSPLSGTDLTDSPLSSWLTAQNAQERYNLACSLTDIFNRYRLESPDGLIRWLHSPAINDDEAWQQKIWQEVLAELGMTQSPLNPDSKPSNPLLFWVEVLEAGSAHPHHETISRTLQRLFPKPIQWLIGEPLPALYERAGRALEKAVPLVVWHYCPFSEPQVPEAFQPSLRILFGDDYIQNAQNESRLIPLAAHQEEANSALTTLQSLVRGQAEVLYRSPPLTPSDSSVCLRSFASSFVEMRSALAWLSQRLANDYPESLNTPSAPPTCVVLTPSAAHYLPLCRALIQSEPQCPFGLDALPALSPNLIDFWRLQLSLFSPDHSPRYALNPNPIPRLLHPIVALAQGWDEGTQSTIRRWLTDVKMDFLPSAENPPAPYAGLMRLALGWFGDKVRCHRHVADGAGLAIMSDHDTFWQQGDLLENLLRLLIQEQTIYQWAQQPHPLQEWFKAWDDHLHQLSPAAHETWQVISSEARREHQPGRSEIIPHEVWAQWVNHLLEQKSQEIRVTINASTAQKIPLVFARTGEDEVLPCDYLIAVGFSQENWASELADNPLDLTHQMSEAHLRQKGLRPKAESAKKRYRLAHWLCQPRRGLWLSAAPKIEGQAHQRPSFAYTETQNLIAQLGLSSSEPTSSENASLPSGPLINNDALSRWHTLWQIKGDPAATPTIDRMTDRNIDWQKVCQFLLNAPAVFLTHSIKAKPHQRFRQKDDETTVATLERLIHQPSWIQRIMDSALQALLQEPEQSLTRFVARVLGQLGDELMALGKSPHPRLIERALSQKVSLWINLWATQAHQFVHEGWTLIPDAPQGKEISLPTDGGTLLCLDTPSSQPTAYRCTWQKIQHDRTPRKHHTIIHGGRYSAPALSWLYYWWWIERQYPETGQVTFINTHDATKITYPEAHHCPNINVDEALQRALSWWLQAQDRLLPIVPDWFAKEGKASTPPEIIWHKAITQPYTRGERLIEDGLLKLWQAGWPPPSDLPYTQWQEHWQAAQSLAKLAPKTPS